MTDTRPGTTASPRRVTGDLVTVEDRGDVRILTLNQPKALNALNADLERRNFLLLLGTEDATEGASAFTERRHPTCKGE